MAPRKGPSPRPLKAKGNFKPRKLSNPTRLKKVKRPTVGGKRSYR